MVSSSGSSSSSMEVRLSLIRSLIGTNSTVTQVQTSEEVARDSSEEQDTVT